VSDPDDLVSVEISGQVAMDVARRNLGDERIRVPSNVVEAVNGPGSVSLAWLMTM
jgi:hypothetical protein